MTRLLRLLAISAAVLPFAFGIIRAISTGNDFRYIWVALASFIGAAALMSVVSVSRSGARGALALSAAVFVVATLAAVLAAMLLGTALGPGILVVASSFGVCFAFGTCLRSLAQR